MSYKYQNRVRLVTVWLLFLCIVPISLVANEAEITLTKYFNLLKQTSSPLQVDVFKKSSDFWVKKDSKMLQFNRFFYAHKPTKWEFKEFKSAGSYASIVVDFNSKNYQKPWECYFEIIKKRGKWKISDFKDITKRALDDTNSNPKDVVDAYFKDVMRVVDLLKSDMKIAEKMRIKRYYSRGAGFWNSDIAQTKSRMFFHWLEKNHPTNYKILTTTQKSSDEATVDVMFEGVKRHKDGYELSFYLKKIDGYWYIVDNYNKKLKKQREINREKKQKSSSKSK